MDGPTSDERARFMNELHKARHLLGVAADANKKDVSRAFREAAKKYHPDVGGAATEFDSVSKAFRLIDASSAQAESQAVAAGSPYDYAPGPIAASPRAHRDLGSSFATVLARHLRRHPVGSVR